MRRLIVFILLLSAGHVCASVANVEEVSIEDYQDKTEITIRMDRLPQYKDSISESPKQIVLDLYKSIGCEIRLPHPIRIISEVSYINEGSTCSIIFHLSASTPVIYDVVTNQALSTLTIIIDDQPQKVVNYPVAIGRDAVIVIDPGHGGKDPGAIGAKGTFEKKITLSVAKRLLKLINDEYGMRGFLTRSDDRFIRLRNRVNSAHRHKADVFISIHADSAKSRSAVGASVYMLSPKGASSEAARLLAQRENEVDLIDGSPFQEGDRQIASILIDLSQTAALNRSRALAREVLRAFGSAAKHDRIESAGFVVLKSFNIASILVELGYLSNPQQEKQLKTAAYQRRLAKDIHTGIRRYIEKFATTDMLLATMGATDYKVVSGDTLSEIAWKFHTKVSDIKKLSKLSSDVIRVGQVIKVPVKRKGK